MIMPPVGVRMLIATRSVDFRQGADGLAATNDWSLMVLVPADPLDVVPGIGLMTKVALLHPRVLLTGDRHRDHLEMSHIVARRRLMALRAILRA